MIQVSREDITTMSNFQCAETLPEWACLSGKDITVIPPNLKTLERKFVVQITGEGLWQWKKISSKLCAFEALNSTLRTLGYSITPAAKPRIAQCLYQAIQSFTKKVSSRLLGKAARDRLKSNKVYELCVEEIEMASMPKDVIDDLTQKKAAMEKEIDELNKQLEEQSNKVYSVLVEQVELKRKLSVIDGLGNKGKKIQEVEERQARRKLNEIR